MTEIWKDIEGYNGRYRVSNLGRVMSMWRTNQYKTHIGKPMIMHQGIHRQGYLKVSLTDGSTIKNYFIHRLVAEAFIPNPDNLPQVNHKDEDKSNNRVDNLEWCDGKYNSNYGTRAERWRPQVAKPIIQKTLDDKFVRRFESAESAERECGYDASYISMVCHNKRPAAYGYKWSFEKKDNKNPEKILEALDELFESLYEDSGDNK